MRGPADEWLIRDTDLDYTIVGSGVLEEEKSMKKLFFNKDRLGAFMDAILAIIMTILVLELAKPKEPTIAAFLSLWHAFAAYAISFFWLGSM